MLHIKLKKLRKNHGFTQKEVANALHIDRTTYSYYEHGKILPNIYTVARLSELYNVSCDYLIKNNVNCESMSYINDLADEVCKKEREVLCCFRVAPVCIQDEILNTLKNIIRRINLSDSR